MKSDIHNRDISNILASISEYLAMQNVPFKPRAYEKAAEAVSELGEEAGRIYERGGVSALEEIPGVGKAIAEKIAELLTTGRLQYYEKLQREMPVDLGALRTVEGLGPKSIARLYRELKVRNIADLERAARAGKIAKLPGFGAKSQEKILKSLAFARESGKRVLLLGAMPLAAELEERLRRVPGVSRVTVAGSLRRRKETIGDLDFLAVSRTPERVMDAFVRFPSVSRVIAHGVTKSSVKLRSGLNVDLRVVEEKSYGAALNYFTGSKDHNVALRELALKKGWKLNEYGLYRQQAASSKRQGWQMIAGKTEEEIYRKLGLAYIEPELRENTGEIESALREAQGKPGGLPRLVGYDDIRGDLQTQTNWTDGRDSIEAMAQAASARGLEYIAITDHTKSVVIAGGMSEGQFAKQWAEIDRVNKKLKGKIVVLKGVECDIRKDGTLDLPDRTLEKFDIVGAAVHFSTKLTRREQTERIKKAMRNPHVDIIFHPTGRIVLRRPPYDADIRELIETARQTKTVLEVNASERLDLSDEHIRMCVASGVKLAIDSDAHRTEHFALLDFGVAQARRGWAAKRDIVNAWPLEKMKKMLK